MYIIYDKVYQIQGITIAFVWMFLECIEQFVIKVEITLAQPLP